MSNPENQTPVGVDPVAAAGATAQTSGFAQAGSSSAAESSSSAAATAPSTADSRPPAPAVKRGSVAAPTFSSSVSTGIFPTATAIPAQYGYLGGPFGGGVVPVTVGGGGGGLQSSPNVPAPGTSIDPATGKPFSAGMTRAELEAKKASEMSGREQAARQLAGPGLQRGSSELSTPGKELPGGWGSVAPVPPPGTSPEAPASIYEDVNNVLHKVGATAYSVLPAGLKEAISNSPDPKGKGKETPNHPAPPRKSSVAAIFENVKGQATEIVNQIKEEHKAPPPTEGDKARRTSQNQPGFFSQVKEFFQDPLEKQAVVAGPVTFKTSKPSDEPLGAKPGEHVSGVGALPGKANETGVAVLPDEKAASTSLPSQENQGLLPGEVSAGAGALPGPSNEAGVAVPPDVKATEGSAGGFVAGAGGSGSQTPAAAAAGPSSASSSGLAPPLPHTNLGEGMSEGATNPNVLTGADAEASAPPSATSSSALTAPPANDRTDSMASVTAIRHGHAGLREDVGPSPLAQSATAASATSDNGNSNQSSTAVGSDAAETQAPAATNAATAPATKHEESAVAESPAAKSRDLPPTGNKTANGGVSPTSPIGKSAAADDKGHRRASSTSSSGKKKAGFMNKLKGEMKVISGKIGGDEAKVQAGEKLKHGE